MRGGNKTTAVWLKKTPNLPASCTGCRLTPHDELGGRCVYGNMKGTESALSRKRTSSVSCGHWGQEHAGAGPGQTALPPAGPEISTVLEGILGRWGGLWLPARERTLTAVTQEKHLLFLHFDLFCRCFWIFFSFFFSPFSTYSVVVVNFIGSMKSN